MQNGKEPVLNLEGVFNLEAETPPDARQSNNHPLGGITQTCWEHQTRRRGRQTGAKAADPSSITLVQAAY